MPKALEILLVIAAPLAWGLGADYVFARLRRWRKEAEETEEAHESEASDAPPAKEE